MDQLHYTATYRFCESYKVIRTHNMYKHQGELCEVITITINIFQGYSDTNDLVTIKELTIKHTSIYNQMQFYCFFTSRGLIPST